jgi:BTB/POZ domain
MTEMAKSLTDPDSGDVCFVLGSRFPGRRLMRTNIFCQRVVRISKLVSLSPVMLTVGFSKQWSKSPTLPHSRAGMSILSAASSPESPTSATAGLSIPAITPTIGKGQSTELSAVITDSISSQSAPDGQASNELHDETRISDTPSQDDAGRIILHIDDIDFVPFHNLLYFLYTGHVNLHKGTSLPKFPEGYPEMPDPFDLFRLADMYIAPALAERCFRYLIHTNTPENICGRLFNILCEPYQNLREEYIKFLLDNYTTVIATVGWKDVLFDTAELGPVERRYWGELLLEISEKLSKRLPAESATNE